MKLKMVSVSPLSFCIAFVSGLVILLACTAIRTPRTLAGSQPATVFSNPAAIAPADRTSNTAGTNPGIPASNYPSPINVAGLTGSITKITVTFAITSTFPDDIDILLVGPTGARSLVISDAGGSGDHSNVTYTFDQAAAAAFPDGGTVVIPAGTYRPGNYTGLTATEPGGMDNFPTPGPGVMAYTADFNVFNGTNPNGTWNLFVVDDQVIDLNSLPGGWSIDITTGPGVAADAPIDFNGDSRSDYVVVRNVGGGPGGQIRWFFNHSSGGATVAWDWGVATDFFVVEDFDGDDKDDIAVFRPSGPAQSRFYILNSATLTARVENFGESGDDPTIVDDYDGDGKADLAVYRSGAAAGQQSFWFYRGSLANPGGNTTYVPWGQNGDFPMPGDIDGNGSADFTIQRNMSGQGAFWTRLSTGVVNPVTIFGFSTDVIVPGDYDGDGKCDIATIRGVGGMIQWHVRSSLNGSISYYTFGLSASDFPVQGDYDGDGKVEPAVWRPNLDPTMNFFYSLNSTNGAVTWFELGQNGDYPVANFNAH